MVSFLVTRVKEGGQAVLQSVQGGLEWEQLVSGDSIVMVMLVQVTPLPQRCIAPPSALVRLGLFLQLLVMRGDHVPLSQLFHHIEQLLPHPPGEVQHVVLSAFGYLPAFPIVLYVGMPEKHVSYQI